VGGFSSTSTGNGRRALGEVPAGADLRLFFCCSCLRFSLGSDSGLGGSSLTSEVEAFSGSLSAEEVEVALLALSTYN